MEEKNRLAPAEERLQDRFEELQQRATKDALSGLLNRATMEQYIRDRLRTMGRKDSCALFIVDLDNFKQVNDTFGHPAGDQAIRKTGQILSGIFRASDIVGRLGGDEFAAFLCGRVTDEMVRQRAADICAQLHIVLGDREIIHLTASVGVYLAGRGQEFEGLYQTADLALYKAKKAGKHRFCLKSREGYQESGREAFRPVNAISLGGLLEQMGSGVALLEMGDPPQVIYVSPSYCRIADLDAGAFPLPKALSELIHPDDLPPLEEALQQGLRQGSAVEHTHRISMDGGRTWRWWYIRAIQVEYNTKAPVMLVTAVDISGFKETERRQAQQIRRLQTALGQTSKRLWEVDLPAGAFCAYTRDGTFRPLGKGETAFPDDLIEGGWIHPGSVARFRDFAQELLGGRAQGFGNFAVRIGDAGCYSWASVSYRTLFDEAGRAVQAVGVLEELPQGLTGRDGWAPDQAQLPERLAADLIVRMRADLDLDTVETLWMEGSDLTGQVRETRCSQVLQLERQKIFCPGEQQEFPAHFDREELLRLFRAGRHWLCAEYRRTDGGGSIPWVRHVLYLAEGPADRHVRLFVYLIRLDPGRLLEPAIHRESRRDTVTRLYDRDSIRGIAEDLFSDRKNGNRAVAVLQVHGLPQPSPGTDAQTEQLRYAIAAALALTLGGSCVLGQHSPDRTVIVFPSVTEKEDLHRSLEEAVAFVRRMLAGEPDGGALRFIMGVQLVPAAAAVYSDMLAQAVRVCDFWWNAAADTVAFAPEDADWDWTQLPRPDREDRVSVIRAAELERPLSEREKDVALDCVSGMLTARTLDASLRGVLQTIGAYYRADRVYTLMLTEERRTVVMTFEWTSARKRSIQQAVSGTRLERFPMLRRCMAEQAPVFLSRQAPIDLDGESEETAPWYFAAVPLIRDQQTEGFLCIENAREHPEDAALFSTLIPFILQQRERFGRAERSAGAAEQLMGLPDLRAYTQALCTLTSEHYSSLGAVCLDIPDFAAISSGLGSEYGSRMLWYVAGTLTDLFGGALLFRTWESQFIAFYPNTTREVFLGRCGRLRSILQRRYPKQVRIGRAWAEGVFSGKRLAEAARAAMRAGRAGDPGGELFPIRQEDASPVAEATRSGRFVVHYQPKIDMRTGALTGAEALVRAVAEDGSVVPPSRFIELLEEDGTIRDLDLFVLEQALSQAEQWRAEGLYVVPLAVNISRATLVHPSTLASVLAIQSRYPQLPPETLELEITERGNIDAAGFRQLAEQFHASGIRIGLDDFGSQYANITLLTGVRFDTLKLDRAIIAELENSPITQTLVRDLVQICRAYGMACVAEGVETEGQVRTLLEMGCTCGQGFYYDRPLPPAAFSQKYLRKSASPGGENPQDKEQCV